MRVGICDFPSAYAFPPVGYGGIERWLWAVAVGARRAGAAVTLLGPQWRRYLPGWSIDPIRLEALDPASDGERIAALERFDLLVVGHEYPSQPSWRGVFDRLDCDVATFQHDPSFRHTAEAFDGVRSRLYCYSPEMVDRYASCRPIPELAVHLGLDEDEPPAVDGDDLVWLGRIDADKAPHIAVMAARRLGRPIRLVGPVFDHAYVAEHGELFDAPHVRLVGELGGPAKVAALREGAILVYTCSRTYVEAGAAVFGESLRAGTPVAALAWRPGTCAQAALCSTTGAVADVPAKASDAEAADALADAIQRASALKAAEVQDAGMIRFDPVTHFITVSSRP